MVVRHHNREGHVREYDFSEPAGRRADAALAGGPVRGPVHAGPLGRARHVLRGVAFTCGSSPEFLARQQRPPRDLDELTAGPGEAMAGEPPVGPYRRTEPGGSSAACCATTPGCRPGLVADELARRRKRPPAKLQSYTEAEFDQFTAVARRQFRAALRRIGDNALHLQRWREGAFAEGTGDWALGEALDVLARTGDLPRYHGTGRVKGKYVSAFGGQSGAVTWQRLFLTREEAVALGVLLLAEFGWNLSVIDSPGDPPRGTRPGRRRPADLPRSRWSSPAAAPAATTSPATSPTTAPARPGG